MTAPRGIGERDWAAAEGVLRLATLASGSDSVDQVYGALAGELLALPAVAQVHLQRLALSGDSGRGVVYATAPELHGRTYRVSGSGLAFSVLAGGRPLTVGTRADLDEGMAASLADEGPVLLLPIVPGAAAQAVIGVVFEPSRWPSREVTAAAQMLAAVAAASLTAREARGRLDTDPGTGCLHGAALLTRLDEEVERARRNRLPLTCLLLELDDVDAIAQRYGQAMCEHAVGHVAKALRSQYRRFDRVGRVGEGAFLVVLPGAAAPSGRVVARRTLGRLHAIKLETRGDRQPLRAAIGLSAWREGQAAPDLLHEARAALRHSSHPLGGQPGRLAPMAGPAMPTL